MSSQTASNEAIDMENRAPSHVGLTGLLGGGCCAVERQWTWRDKLNARLFPIQHCFAPEAPGRFKDCVTVRTTTVMSWVDRLRLLVTGIVVTETRTVTENEVGDSETASVCYVGTKRDLKGASWL